MTADDRSYSSTTLNDVLDALKYIKRFKYDGKYSLTADHVVYSSRRFFGNNIFSILMSSMLVHGYNAADLLHRCQQYRYRRKLTLFFSAIPLSRFSLKMTRFFCVFRVEKTRPMRSFQRQVELRRLGNHIPVLGKANSLCTIVKCCVF